jgi:hypothetical protein
MTLLVELMELITDTMVGVDQVSRDAAYSRAVDIAPFVDDLGAAGLDGGLTSCGEQAFCLGETVLLFAVVPLITPEGIGLADVAVGSWRVTAFGSSRFSADSGTSWRWPGQRRTVTSRAGSSRHGDGCSW